MLTRAQGARKRWVPGSPLQLRCNKKRKFKSNRLEADLSMRTRHSPGTPLRKHPSLSSKKDRSRDPKILRSSGCTDHRGWGLLWSMPVPGGLHCPGLGLRLLGPRTPGCTRPPGPPRPRPRHPGTPCSPS